MRVAFLISFFILIIPFVAGAQLIISEIAYNLDGSDGGREWVEVFNSGAEPVDLAGWRFFENGTNHKINLVDESGDFMIPTGGYAVIADDPKKFLLDWPDFSGIIFDSAFSLNNTGENIILRDNDLNDIDSVSYSSEWGANGDGNSLQKIDGNWKAAVPTPGSQNAEPEEVGGQIQEGQIKNQTQTQQDSYNYGSAQATVENKIKASAGEDKLGVAGADIEFIGKAWGLKDEPLDFARFIWNFGDGSFKEGKAVRHNYSFPGEYIVVLDVSSGEYSTSHIINAKIIPNEVIISEVNPLDSWVKIYNGSDELIDISFWRIKNGKQYFVFPKNTFIKPKNHLVISQVVSGLILNIKEKVELLYPNNSVADEFLYQKKSEELKQPQNFSESENAVVSSKKKITEQNNHTKNSIENSMEVLNFDGDAATDSPPEPNFQNESDFQNEANVLGGAEDSSNLAKWILIVSGVALFSGIGFLVLKKYN